MKVVVLASGSKGNVTYIEYKHTKILIDLGMNLTYIKKGLKEHDIHLRDINAVLITHTHTDHIFALESFAKKYNSNIYITAKMNKDLGLETYQEFSDINYIEDLEVEIIHTSHDKPSVGFVIRGDKELVYITDTGYLKESYHEKLSNKDLYIIESNHDLEMLTSGSYPYYLKQRIWGDKGHLSNKATAEHLKKLVGEKTKFIVLAHLSENNNTEELAFTTLSEHLGETEIEIIIAKQNEPLKAINF